MSNLRLHSAWYHIADSQSSLPIWQGNCYAHAQPFNMLLESRKQINSSFTRSLFRRVHDQLNVPNWWVQHDEFSIKVSSPNVSKDESRQMVLWNCCGTARASTSNSRQAYESNNLWETAFVHSVDLNTGLKLVSLCPRSQLSQQAWNTETLT